MATVKIYRDEAEDDILPQVCAKCGRPSTLTKDKNFRWHPPWLAVLILLGGIGLLLYIILALSLSKYMRIRVPFCDDHRNHWIWRTTVIVVSFVILLAGFFVWVAMVSNQGNNRGNNEMSEYFCMATVGVGLIWLIAAVVLQMTAIRPQEITDRHIVLTGVCEGFKDAMLDEREQEEEREDREHEQRRGRRDRDDDRDDERDDDRDDDRRGKYRR